jgi:hypothetical protein
MTDKTIDERKAELAELLKDASNQPATPEGAQGAFSIPNLWGLVAAHLFDAIEQIVQEAIQRLRDEQKGK